MNFLSDVMHEDYHKVAFVLNNMSKFSYISLRTAKNFEPIDYKKNEKKIAEILVRLNSCYRKQFAEGLNSFLFKEGTNESLVNSVQRFLLEKKEYLNYTKLNDVVFTFIRELLDLEVKSESLLEQFISDTEDKINNQQAKIIRLSGKEIKKGNYALID